MPKLSRLAIALAAVLLAGAFVVPVWRIDLVAPQYPEGIGMLIRVNTITGIKPNDLNNINSLNHYIGMKVIEPAAIPVLDVMPVVLGALVVTGLIVALYGRRWAAWSWLGLLGVAVMRLSDRVTAAAHADRLAEDVLAVALAGLQTGVALESTAVECAIEAQGRRQQAS